MPIAALCLGSGLHVRGRARLHDLEIVKELEKPALLSNS